MQLPRSMLRPGAVVLAGMACLSAASACCLPGPSTMPVVFVPGSAVIAPGQESWFEVVQEVAGTHPIDYRVLVRGYADQGSGADPASWKAQDLALADARARALSAAMRVPGGPRCVQRVAYGRASGVVLPKSAFSQPPEGPVGGEVVTATRNSEEPAVSGVPIETDCGEAAPRAVFRSDVILPERAGVFVHERSRKDWQVHPNVVIADYGAPTLAGDPWVQLRLIPDAGASEAAAVAALAQGFEDSLRNNPGMRNVTELPASAIRVGDSVGSRQSFTYMDRDGQDTRHAGLVFHRNLFDIELRVRMAAEDIPQAKFDALADESAREIVSRLELRHFGTCAGLGPQDNCTPTDPYLAEPAPAPSASPSAGVKLTFYYPEDTAPK